MLFDLGATHTFVYVVFATKHIEVSRSLDIELSVDTPVSGKVITTRVYKSCVLNMEGKKLLANLIKVEMKDFDMILGMD